MRHKYFNIRRRSFNKQKKYFLKNVVFITLWLFLCVLPRVLLNSHLQLYGNDEQVFPTHFSVRLTYQTYSIRVLRRENTISITK